MSKLLTEKRVAFIYKITLPILALIALLILMSIGSNCFHPKRQPLIILILNQIIWLIFTADFAVRTYLSEDRKHFVTSHLAEFIAIIPIAPLSLLAEGLNYAHMRIFAGHMLEIIFVIMFFSYLIRAFTIQRRFIKTNPLHYAAAITMTSLVVAAILFSNFEGRSYADSIWWAFVTASTTGFGDVVPVTPGGRTVGIFLMVVGVSCISMLTGAIAIRLMYSSDGLHRKESGQIKGIIMDLTHFSELSAEEVDDMCAVLKILKERQNSSDRKYLEKKYRVNGDISKNGSGNKHLKIWLQRTFMSNPKDDLLIENKLIETEEKTKK